MEKAVQDGVKDGMTVEDAKAALETGRQVKFKQWKKRGISTIALVKDKASGNLMLRMRSENGQQLLLNDWAHKTKATKMGDKKLTMITAAGTSHMLRYGKQETRDELFECVCRARRCPPPPYLLPEWPPLQLRLFLTADTTMFLACGCSLMTGKSEASSSSPAAAASSSDAKPAAAAAAESTKRKSEDSSSSSSSAPPTASSSSSASSASFSFGSKKPAAAADSNASATGGSGFAFGAKKTSSPAAAASKGAASKSVPFGGFGSGSSSSMSASASSPPAGASSSGGGGSSSSGSGGALDDDVRLHALNKAFIAHVSAAVSKDSTCDLSPCLQDYLKHAKSIIGS